MDNASYYSARVEVLLTLASRKTVMKQWLTDHGLHWDAHMSKAVLYELVKQHKSRYMRYNTDEKAKENGHTVLRLPLYHCDLNPIEMVWSQIKQYTKARNTTFKIKDVDLLMREAITHVTAEQCDNYGQNVLKN